MLSTNHVHLSLSPNVLLNQFFVFFFFLKARGRFPLYSFHTFGSFDYCSLSVIFFSQRSQGQNFNFFFRLDIVLGGYSFSSFRSSFFAQCFHSIACFDSFLASLPSLSLTSLSPSFPPPSHFLFSLFVRAMFTIKSSRRREREMLSAER